MQLNYSHPVTYKRQRGITLIEALLALFIISIGLLGVAGLQATSISAGHSSTLRSLAVFHAAEIAERMRANRTAALTYATTGKANNCSDADTRRATTCTAIQMAEEDVFAWERSLGVSFANMSPSSTITVTAPTVTGASFSVVITVNWSERGTAMTYQTSTQI